MSSRPGPPGGTQMKVKDVMVVGAVTIRGDENVARAAALMREQGVGMLVVSNGQRMDGGMGKGERSEAAHGWQERI
mgnify:CR=1 FL=1